MMGTTPIRSGLRAVHCGSISTAPSTRMPIPPSRKKREKDGAGGATPEWEFNPKGWASPQSQSAA